MAQPQYTSQEIASRGEEIYEREFRDKLEPAQTGKFLVIDIDTGDYEIDADEVAALQRAIARSPDGHRYLKRIGFPAAHCLAGEAGRQRPSAYGKYKGIIPSSEEFMREKQKELGYENERAERQCLT